VFTVRAHDPVFGLMRSTGFCDYLGTDHFLAEDEAITYLFHNIIDPAICIYECEVRAFKECQNLPKQIYPIEPPFHTDIPTIQIADISPHELWQQLCSSDVPPLVIDVREPREFRRGHIPQAQLSPLPKLLSDTFELPKDHPIVFVCRGGRRSARAVNILHNKGYEDMAVLRGGMLAWEAAGLLEAIDESVA
jgi:SulP family sulfate permease